MLTIDRLISKLNLWIWTWVWLIRSLPARIKRGSRMVTALLVIIALFAAPVSAYAFNLETAGSKLLSFALFCLIIIVAVSAGMSLARSNVMGAAVVILVGVVIYGVLDPTAFKDVANGIKAWLGIGGGTGGTS